MHARATGGNFLGTYTRYTKQTSFEKKNPVYLVNTIASKSKDRRIYITHSKDLMQYLRDQCTAELIQGFKHLQRAKPKSKSYENNLLRDSAIILSIRHNV